MDIYSQHEWEVSVEEALKIQEILKKKICLCKPHRLTKVAAADVTYLGNKATAGVLVFTYPGLELLEEVLVSQPVKFPYIPGLLAFREAPPIIEALKKVKEKVDLLMLDGHGIAHPRRMGIATHLGIYLEMASLGCAKSKLTGTHSPLPPERGSYQPLYDDKEMIGWVVRTRYNTKPVFASPGNFIDFKTTLEVVLNCSLGYRIPEPLRLVHLLVNKKVKVG